MQKEHYSNAKTFSQRQLKVGELLRHALSEIFLEEALYEEGVKGVSVTVSEVRVSPDLRNATVFLLPLGGDQSDVFLQGIKKLGPRLRALVTKKVNLRYSPELNFRLDQSFDQVDRIESLLRTVAEPAEEAKSGDE